MKTYRCIVVMVNSETREQTSFEITTPAVDSERAKSAAINLGFAINEATGHLLKILRSTIAEVS